MRIPEDRPVYRLSEPFFDGQDQYHEKDKLIIFDGVPNQSMIPMNDLARKRYDGYMDKLDEGLKLACDKNVGPDGKPAPLHFTPHPRIYDEPEEEIVDVSRQAPRHEQIGIKIGNRRKEGGGAEALN